MSDEPIFQPEIDFSTFLNLHPLGVALSALIRSFPEGSPQHTAMAKAIEREVREMRTRLDLGKSGNCDPAFAQDLIYVAEDLGVDISAVPQPYEFDQASSEENGYETRPASSASDDTSGANSSSEGSDHLKTDRQKRKNHLRLVEERKPDKPTAPDSEDQK